MKNIKIYLTILTLSFSLSTFAQLSKKEIRKNKKELKAQEIEQLIDSKSFIFQANSLTSNTGYHKMLNSEYDFIVKNDSVFSHLPFWGRAYSHDINEEGGFKFEEKSTDYDLVNLKEKGYQISLIAKVDKDNYQIQLNISKQGYARLVIISTRKSHISYNGQIEAIPSSK